ncbi:hypothetical protein CHLNCDRAFT_140182 [Chlorella variabilis]|uniref:Bromo domain-containing protein n=1 Tax=Chlorella variabilis TaxID=554065 RepID=E1ZRQ3_CHLVA|nr:hypothetical protein CHLNCDRAFT_140182 [Chlorella variabilis]EFN51450.1 hypothetical protein CHLNCDRAFT_140182 [Chlorella variabilis]|eukprot:XP_005843552.1 hypothetical protein CHLNCDRAFT_140182 [Chlorella variabilis]
MQVRELSGTVMPVGDTEIFSLKDAARPPSEAELRKKLTPEEACTLEACYVAAFRMKQRGLVMHEKLDKAASAPWTLTDAFVTHFREGKAQLQLAGAADPTGRGFGYSFVRDVRHKHANADDVTKQMAKRQAGKVQGTDADLRRMTTAQAKERLRGYGMTEEEIQGLGRWTMIDMAIKFVRHQKTTMIELQRRAAEKAQQILEKQMAVLNNSAGEDLGDQDALEAELEQELAAAEEAAEAEGGGATSRPTPQSKKGKREGTPTADDEQRMMQQMRAEGLMDAAAGAGATDAGTAAAAPSWTPGPGGAGGPAPKEGFGTKRIRREVFLKAADGSWQKSHEIVYMGRDRPGQLHSLYQASADRRSFGSAMLPPGAEAWGAAEAALVLLRADVEQAAGDAVARRQPRSDFEDEFEDEFEEEEEELSDEDEEMFEEEDPGTSDEGATPQRQLGTVGRQLGAILSAIVQQLRNTKMPFGYPQKMTKVYELVYGKVPSNKHAPDYHAFVPKSSVIILPEVQKKAKAGRYLSLEQFRADLQQLYNNAVAYNSPGIGGAYGDPYFIELAAKLLEDAEGLIARHLGEIQAVEVRS